MGKGKGLTFAIFAALGAIAGYATYMANKNEFSDETKEKYNKVINKISNVGTDIKRTYTSIGDKEEFTSNTKNLGNSAMKLASKTGDLVVSASSDMYKFAKNQITSAIEKSSDDDTKNTNDDLDVNYVSTKGGKKKTKNNITKKENKTTTKKTNKTKKENK